MIFLDDSLKQAEDLGFPGQLGVRTVLTKSSWSSKYETLIALMSVIDRMEIQKLLSAWSNQWIKNAQMGGGEHWLFGCQGHDFQKKNGPPPSVFAGKIFLICRNPPRTTQRWGTLRYLNTANIRCSVPLACQLCRQYGATCRAWCADKDHGRRYEGVSLAALVELCCLGTGLWRFPWQPVKSSAKFSLFSIFLNMLLMRTRVPLALPITRLDLLSELVTLLKI